MATKTRSGVGGVLFLAIALVAGIGYMGYVKRTPYEERAGVVFTVTFQPTKRVEAVSIVVMVGGAVRDSTKVRSSPWTGTYTLRRGQTATVTAIQVSTAKLSCAVNGDVQETRELPGAVICTHKRV